MNDECIPQKKASPIYHSCRRITVQGQAIPFPLAWHFSTFTGDKNKEVM
jgi:hypothetical protein